MILIVGLGNIGPLYNNTRHNVGFMVVDKIQSECNFSEWKEKFNYLYSKGRIDNIDVMLIKPTTFMNLSGTALVKLVNMNKIPLNDIIVIHDDLDLDLGKIKIKQGGSSAGHNGLKSIDSNIGNGYYRLRIGISHPKNINLNISVADYVLGKFLSGEKMVIDEIISFISENFNLILKKDFSKFLNLYKK